MNKPEAPAVQKVEGLKPCPFCAAAGEELGLCYDTGHLPMVGTDWFVRCYVCHVETARFVSHAEAIAAWNRRAPLAKADTILGVEGGEGWVLVPREPTEAMLAAAPALPTVEGGSSREAELMHPADAAATEAGQRSEGGEPKDEIVLKVTHAEHATILAALRFYQEKNQGDPSNRLEAVHDLATNGDQVISLDNDDIDELCESLNLCG